MLDATKIRISKSFISNVRLYVAVLSLSILAGAGFNRLMVSAPHESQDINNAGSQGDVKNDKPTGLMAAELMVVSQVARPATATPKAQPVTPSQNRIVTAAPAAVTNMAVIDVPATEPAAATAVQPEAPAATQVAAVENSAAPAPQIPEGYRIFNGRYIRPAYNMTMVTTAYSPDAKSCGIHADGITASGKSVWTNNMRMVAADTKLLPFGTLVSVPGYYDGMPVPVLDRGGAIKGNRLDMLYPTHEIALTWGRKTQLVTIWEYVD